jgi:hypothetical protein
MVDQNKWVVFLLELPVNIEYKIVIQYDMK